MASREGRVLRRFWGVSGIWGRVVRLGGRGGRVSAVSVLEARRGLYAMDVRGEEDGWGWVVLGWWLIVSLLPGL